MTAVADFLTQVRKLHSTGIAREHAYRPALHDLLAAMGEKVTPVNDPAKSSVGAPDFIVVRDGIPVGYVEAKDIDVDLRALRRTSPSRARRTAKSPSAR